jgi:hypothetical protein
MAKADKKRPPKDRQFVAALAKGLEVLQCFGPSTPELGASEIARMTGMPQPTVWRICYTLIQLGFLVVLPGRQTMRPGIPLLGLGHAVLAGLPRGDLELPDMLAIASGLRSNRNLRPHSASSRNRAISSTRDRCTHASTALLLRLNPLTDPSPYLSVQAVSASCSTPKSWRRSVRNSRCWPPSLDRCSLTSRRLDSCYWLAFSSDFGKIEPWQ